MQTREDAPRRNPGDEAEPGLPQTAENTCRECRGTGLKEDGTACNNCGGTGMVIETVGDA